MTLYANYRHHFVKGSFRFIALLCCWIVGLAVGYCLYEPLFLPLMHRTILQPVSIVGVICLIILPLVCSYFSFLTDKPIIILVVCFIKAVAFGFSGALISQMFYSAAWMVRFLIMFSDICFTVVLFILWIRRFLSERKSGYSDHFVCAVIGTGIALTDHFLIWPILNGLI